MDLKKAHLLDTPTSYAKDDPRLKTELEALTASVTYNPTGKPLFLTGAELAVTGYGWVYRRLGCHRPPRAALLYSGPVMYDDAMDITLIATARDYDRLNGDIVEFEWSMDDVVVGTEKMYNVPARNLSNGWHGFSMRAKDGEGHWSNSVTVNVYVTDILNYVRLPLVLVER